MNNYSLDKIVIIDDDSTNNLICNHIIKKAQPDLKTESFTDPEVAVTHLTENVTNGNVIVLLDINMPNLSGWEVLDQLIESDTFNIDRHAIYMLSSSVASEDKQRAKAHPLVRAFIEKPLNIEKLERIMNEMRL